MILKYDFMQNIAANLIMEQALYRLQRQFVAVAFAVPLECRGRRFCGCPPLSAGWGWLAGSSGQG